MIPLSALASLTQLVAANKSFYEAVMQTQQAYVSEVMLDLVRFEVTVTMELEASVTDERALWVAKTGLERHFWTWNSKVVEVRRIDGGDRP